MKIRLSGTPTSNPIMMFRRNSRGPAITCPSCGAAELLVGGSTGDTGERLYQRGSCHPDARAGFQRVNLKHQLGTTPNRSQRPAASASAPAVVNASVT
jgi:hypothetical protein